MVRNGASWFGMNLARYAHERHAAPPVDVIQRVRAARGAVNKSLDDFANAIGIGRQTLIRIESGSRTPRDHEYEAMAAVSGLPLAFFYIEDLDAVLEGHEDPSLRDEVNELREDVVQLQAGLVAATADILQHARELEELRDKDRPQQRPEAGD
jgi:transcriptional regulator with XRE-family HTH domain